MLNTFTLVIPTYNRYPFLLRLLKFYESYCFPFRIIVLDSSSDLLESGELKKLLAHESIIYKKLDSGIFFEEKIARGVEEITTPYAALCADDDFIIPSAVSHCIQFLEQNPDYSCVQGFYIHHSSASHFKAGKFKWAPLYFNARCIEYVRADERVYAYLAMPSKAGGQHYYAVHRSDTLRLIRRETAKYASVYNLGELFSGSLSLIYGKRKILPIFFSSREPHNLPPFDEEYHRSLYASERFERAIKGIAKHLHREEGLSLEEAEGVARKSLSAYVNRAFPARRLSMVPDCFRRFIAAIRSLKSTSLNRLYRIYYARIIERESAPYYPDFQKVKYAVISSGIDANEYIHSRTTYKRIQGTHT